ncbi:MAG TPA: hypothetical protein VMZ25_03750 [Terriglobales bacterium]|nr:hypothetical protein [Terriglobales bacterium]
MDPCLLQFAEEAPSRTESDLPEKVEAAPAVKLASWDDKALFSSSRETKPESFIGNDAALAKPESDVLEPIDPPYRPRQGFQWGAALRQSGKLLIFQQGMMLATDKWARYSLTHFRFFPQYFSSVRGGLHQWDDGDPFLDNYIGHPLQGAVTGFIQVQNDPRGRALSFGNNKTYWKSRLKAMAWTAAYSTQFEIGPISESSIEKLGSFQYQNCNQCPLVPGAGWVDIVVTPTMGTAWLVTEDVLDRYVVQRIERKLGRGKWSNLFRSVLNPSRVAANALRMKAPWYRDRDHEMPRLTD